MRVYTFTSRNRGTSLLVGLLVLGAGLGLLVLGLALLAGIAIVGGVLGAGILAYRALRGQRPPPVEQGATPGLDPALEVFSPPRTIGPNDERTHG